MSHKLGAKWLAGMVAAIVGIVLLVVVAVLSRSAADEAKRSLTLAQAEARRKIESLRDQITADCERYRTEEANERKEKEKLLAEVRTRVGQAKRRLQMVEDWKSGNADRHVPVEKFKFNHPYRGARYLDYVEVVDSLVKLYYKSGNAVKGIRPDVTVCFHDRDGRVKFLVQDVWLFGSLSAHKEKNETKSIPDEGCVMLEAGEIAYCTVREITK